jgi:tetratricopeptide (TPR) repeat protein
MKLESAIQDQSGRLAAAALALLGLMSGLAWAAAPPVPLTPEQIAQMLQEGEGVLKGGNPELAISKYFEPINQSFMRETAKAGADDEVYASHGATETAAYTAKIAKKNEGAKTPTKLVIVSGAWTDALVLKARAQAQLQKLDQARSTLDMAAIISPADPAVWMEMGSIEQGAKNWDKALTNYHNAENFAGAVDDKDKQKQVMCEALRGQAAVLTETSKLDEAAAMYKRCLKFVPGDNASNEGLEHVAALGGPAVPAPTPAPAAPGAAAAKTPPPTKPH